MMTHERLAKYFATCNTTECFSELLKIALLSSTLWLVTLMWRIFFDAATMPQTQKKDFS